MATEIDLRDRPDEEGRERLRDALDATETGEELRIVADRDVDVDLIRYQIDRGRDVEWEYEQPDAEPREVRAVDRGELDGGALGTADVRELLPQRRHEVLLAAFDGLDPDEGFVLVNDHDPKPLYYELQSTYGDVVGWEYASRESGEWRVEIRKTAESTAAESEAFTRYDVREIPKPDRHETIHHRYGMIPDGETMEIIAPHEPRPLHGEFRERYGDAFRWEVVETEPGRCRVRITKTEGSAAASDEGGSESAADDGTAAGGSEGGAGAGGEPPEVARELDVRDLPPAQRHEEIFDAYAALDDGDGFVLVNDHDPKPLYHQFETEAGPEFHWEYRKQEPGEFRVLIGKSEAGAEGQSVSEETSAPF
ncbi:uncharacterized protein (DUF2249 family) [Halorubrum trapanicum]|uniref:Uncharacterized protein (DUF2249 family) n=1 Tax=Halorubrum trapanicum TaxID=29284 RepID=A0A8J7RRK1_9EURY|nr:DUF2249 domain-containing protein [Halorubrum trapanicum]MBP1900652.1 uncharacterized protein (DUF2249 family) [Halorubrum trapanicum]